MKKFAIIMLSIALVFSCALIAFADPTPTYSITINNAIPGEDYSAYKIFDVTMDSTTPGGDPDTYAYTITPASPWWNAVITPANGDPSPYQSSPNEFTVDGLTFKKSTQTQNGQPVYLVARESGDWTVAQNEAFTSALANKLAAAAATGNIAATASMDAPDAVAPADKSTVVFDLDSAGPGYYFVTTEVGSLCILDTTNPTVTLDDKNTVPSIDKKISKISGSGWTDDYVNASINDRVYFQITVTDGKGTNQEITVTDEMNEGIKLWRDATTGDHDITVYAGDPLAEVAAGAETYALTVTESGANADRAFEIVFDDAFVTALGENDQIVITYSGVVTAQAVVKGTLDANDEEQFNTNNVVLTYDKWEAEDQVSVETYEFDIVKTMTLTYNYRLLDGAQFKLYATRSGNDEIGLVLVDTIYVIDDNTGLPTDTVAKRIYRLAGPGETAVDHIDAGVAVIRGVGNGTYYVEETEAPAGYNKLTQREDIVISNGNNNATFLANGNYDISNGGGLQVINSTGAELPSTGGIGTYLFYGIGAILVVGAVVVLVSKKRMHAYGE